jgi:hypothetical protein
LPGFGITATENFFGELKSALFEQVFGTRVALTRANETEEEPPF